MHGTAIARRIIAAIGQELSLDRTDLVPAHDVRRARFILLPLIATVTVLGFGPSIVEGAILLLGYDDADTTLHVTVYDMYTWSRLIPPLAQDVVIGLLATALMHLLRNRPAPDSHHPTPGIRTEARTFIMAFAVQMLGAPLMWTLSPWLPFAFHPSAATAIGQPAETLLFIAWAAAGLLEEPVVGLLIVGMRRCRISWSIITAVIVVLRIACHIYNGWAVLCIALWPLLTVMLYRRTGALLPIILAHGAFNVSVLIDSYLPGSAWFSRIATMMVAAGVAIAAVEVLRKAFTPVTA